MKKKIMAEEGSFRLENIKRRSRYTLVFSLLAAALFAMLVININSGNVHIPIDNIIKITSDIPTKIITKTLTVPLILCGVANT